MSTNNNKTTKILQQGQLIVSSVKCLYDRSIVFKEAGEYIISERILEIIKLFDVLLINAIESA